MKIGILTYHLSHNYGAFLQAYALTMRLREEFPDDVVELINYNMKLADKHYWKVVFTENKYRTIIYNIKRYNTFIKAKKLLPVGDGELHSNNLDEFADFVRGKYDLIIVGSDEIWRLTGFRGFPNPYWLPGDFGCMKMSYAASSRSDNTLLKPKDQELLKGFLNDFEYVGVRDTATFDNFKEYIVDNIHINCDPTFIFDFQFDIGEGKHILLEKFGINPEKKTVGIMVDNVNDVGLIQSLFGSQYNYVALYRKHPNTFSYASLTPFEWINVICALDFFFTSFFHGMCFSLMTGTPFIALEKNVKIKDNSKCLDLLVRIRLEDRYTVGLSKGDIKLRDRLLPEIGQKFDYLEHLKPMQEEFNGFVKEIRTLLERRSSHNEDIR